MRPVLHQYKLRLTNLSQANRSLRLGRLSKRKDLDLTAAAFANKLSSQDIVQRIVAGRSVDLVRTLSARDEQRNLLDRHLNKMYREVTTIYEETGTDDLFLGYPFVEGRFLDGTVARCPLLLFPVSLERDFQRSPRWRLNVPPEEDVSLNRTFFLAYEKYMQVRLTPEFWDSPLEHHGDLQTLLNFLFGFLKQHEIQINFNHELFQFKVARYMDKNKALLEQMPVGVLKLQPHAVLGIFPQADSALRQDYEVMEARAAEFDLEQLFAPQTPPAIDPYIKEDRRHFVTPVDQSQEEALLSIRHGRSVVVHGPPGTGKSQVILNLIADALARGQKVLVCSQKRAALDVVYHRLHEIGLSRFAALVHDYRGDRNKIFRHIRRQIEDIETFTAERQDLNLDKWQRDFRRAARRIDEFNHRFDELVEALTKVGRFGLSPHQLYLAADSRRPFADVSAHARNFDYGEMEAFLRRLEDILRYAEFFREGAPWRNRRSFHRYGLNDRPRLRKFLAGLSGEIAALHTAAQRVKHLQEPFRHPEEITTVIDAYQDLGKRLADPQMRRDYAAYVGQNLNMTEVRRQLEKFARIFHRQRDFEILDDFSMLLLPDLVEHFTVYDALRKKGTKFFSLKWLRGRWYVKRILEQKGRKLRDKHLRQMKAELEVLQRLLARYEELEGVHFFADLPLTDSPEKLLAWHTQKLATLELVKAVRAVKVAPGLKPMVKEVTFDEGAWARTTATLTHLDKLRTLLQTQHRTWSVWLDEAQIDRLKKGMEDLPATQGYAEALIRGIDADYEDLRALDRLLKEFSPRERAVLDDLESEIGPLAPDSHADWLDRVRNGFFTAWIEVAEAETPILTEVSSRRMPRMREEFRDTVRDRQEKVVQLILRKLKDGILDRIEYNRLNNPVTYREIGHQVRKKRLRWSVRKLVREFWDNSLNRLMPCWLASPESVAAVFPMERAYFDLVIFDEASQCYVERALPVMLRGKHCVIAGDDKQLPPFDLYNVKIEDAEEAFVEHEMAMEVESVLDLARNIFRECKLNWHYRSREEELINFSNHAFYEGRLNIIPPARSRLEFQPPIEFIKVAGRWERKANRAEAERILALVEELIQRPDRPTVGIVTFNFFQKELIRDRLEQRLQELGKSGDTELLGRYHAAWERSEEEEFQGIFVKNIENVQGDERDVIIFSVGYARNAQGRLVTNFGLLSQKGGENRLNVAVTRARHKIYMVCSFDPEELSVEGAKYPGPVLFKRYLQYARAVSTGQVDVAANLLDQINTQKATASAGRRPDTGSATLAEKIGQALRDRGYEVVTDVGDTNYKVDLAVVDPAGGFRLGIECEGSNYFRGRSSKEREVYRHSLMSMRGWQVHRVWARNYFLSPEKEIERIVACLDKR